MYTQYLFTLFFLAVIIFTSSTLNGQGCVAIRQYAACGGSNPATALLSPGQWQGNMNYRYFKSFRHFRGTHEEPDRVANGTEVINHAHAWDFSLNYGLTSRLYATATLPFVQNVRSSLYEHGREERHTTFSRGLADVRVGVGFWLMSPERSPKGNLALGLGIKLPTGNYQATDIFYNVGPNGGPQVRPVDQSIQPGDGGFGATLELQFFQEVSPALSVYGSAFYLANPRASNGVRTFREALSPVLANEAVMSVPDQYALRAGLSWAPSLPALSFSLGGRYEAIPVRDLIGGSGGFRRPGAVASVEPGVGVSLGKLTFSLSVPVALWRNRPQSLTDRATELATGQPRNGDAAFADYLVNFGCTFLIGSAAVPAMDGH